MEEKLFTMDNFRTYFSWQKFHELTKEQRSELLDFTVKQISAEKGLHSVKLEFMDMEPSCRGFCTPQMGFFNNLKGHSMVLNSDILKSNSKTAPYSIYNTVNHELEHANQYERASDRTIGNDDSATLEQRLNDEHYYSASGDKVFYRDGVRYRTIRFDDETDYQLYQAQACEADARAEGLKAVEELKKLNVLHGIDDKEIDDYLEYAKANEITNNRDMMKQLGMHSRENMVREELSHISEKKVSLKDREKVIAYARQKDYEVAKEVLLDDSNGNLTEEQVKQKFENNNEYNDFYQSDIYRENKVNESERKFYKYSNYKWESDNLSLHEDEVNAQRGKFRKIFATESRPDINFTQQRTQFRDSMSCKALSEVNNESLGVEFSNVVNSRAESENINGEQNKGVENNINR